VPSQLSSVNYRDSPSAICSKRAVGCVTSGIGQWIPRHGIAPNASLLQLQPICAPACSRAVFIGPTGSRAPRKRDGFS
jgi:hypothetical protein